MAVKWTLPRLMSIPKICYERRANISYSFLSLYFFQSKKLLDSGVLLNLINQHPWKYLQKTFQGESLTSKSFCVAVESKEGKNGWKRKLKACFMGVESSEQENESSTRTVITNLISSEVLRLPSTQDLPMLFKHHSFLFLTKNAWSICLSMSKVKVAEALKIHNPQHKKN